MSAVAEELLPVHGFVLAGGKSSRMGQDKATLPFRGTPMVEIAVRKLRRFCEAVSIVGHREDLARFADVLTGEQVERGPAAGIEVGLKACQQPWALFTPVDVPLVPAGFLLLWVKEALRADVSVSYLGVGRAQPAFCLVQRERATSFSTFFRAGEGRLEQLLKRTAEADRCTLKMYGPPELFDGAQGHAVQGHGVQGRGPEEQMAERWFQNVNTPSELAVAEAFRV